MTDEGMKLLRETWPYLGDLLKIQHSAGYSGNALIQVIDRIDARLASGGWIPVSERLPTADEWALVHNGKWRGVARHRPLKDDGYMTESERWQSETTELIEYLGPKVIGWQPLPPLPKKKG